jgi:G3E family GTPase
MHRCSFLTKSPTVIPFAEQKKAQDLYRCKGVLKFKGSPEKYVFHGVHEQVWMCWYRTLVWSPVSDQYYGIRCTLARLRVAGARTSRKS